ncbi:MAG TPA: protein kinase, partial [Gemmatimonadales bacterium]|nr:protein kinase [Gemmatimonadales bacterium]
RELGQGGMATVYLAEDLRHHRNVAVKVLRPDLAATMGPERFAREIEVAARLQHPHILGLLDSGEARPEQSEGPSFLYYVMPYVEGETLRERLSRTGEFPVPEAVRLLGEIAEALAMAHRHGVVHRDIKPENILLSGRHAMVMDFGVAKAVTEASGRQQLTTAGIALGTPAYMAPEQATADPHLDGRVDIYALGVVGYEMLAGQTPFHGLNPQQTLAAHVTTSPQPLGQMRAGLSPALEAALMKCLAKRPADRYQNADDLATALEPLATPSGGMTPTYTQPIAAAPAASRAFPRWLAWAAGGALVAGGALALTLVRRPEAALVVGKRIAIAVSPNREQWPSLAPDGKTIVFTRTEKGVERLFVQQVDGGVPLAVTTQLPDFQCCGALSPDGSRLLFLSGEGLYIVPTLGGQARQVVSGPGLSLGRLGLLWGSWSADGRRIAYSEADTIFTQGTEERERVAVAEGGWVHSPAWSSDGKWIAFVRGNPQFALTGNLAPSSISVVPAGGGPTVQLTDSLSLNVSPVWLPGRMTILFISDKDGGRDVYQLNLSSSGRPSGPPVRITTGLNPDRISLSADGKRMAWSVYSELSNVWSLPIPGRDSVPLSQASPVTTGDQTIETATASRDGKWLYYDSDLRGNADIWRVPMADGVATGPPEQITSDPAPEFDPSISPDGKEVAFHSFRTGNRDIFVMPVSGGPAVQVTNSQEHDWNPRWSPDGQALVFDEQLSQESTLLIVRRHADGTWEAPQALPHKGFGALAVWSPDGQSIAFSGPGVKVIDLKTDSERSLIQSTATASTWLTWSPDARSIYYVDDDALRGFLIRVVPAAGGLPRTLAYANAPDRQLHRYGFSAAQGRFFFPLTEQKADVWVAEVESK